MTGYRCEKCDVEFATLEELEHLNYAFARQLIPLRLTFIMLYVSLL
jgi:hypothetical protein